MAAAFAVTPAGRKVTGVHSVPSSQPGVQAGEQAEGHPRLGDRLPGAVDLGDLDQVVHQRQPGEARPASAASAISLHPRPGSSPQGNRDSCSTIFSPWDGGGGRGSGPDRGLGSIRTAVDAARCAGPRDDLDAVPALVAEASATARDGAAYLLGEDRCRNGPVAAGVATPALVAGRVEQYGDRRQPGCAGRVAPGDPAVGVQAEGVDDGRQPA